MSAASDRILDGRVALVTGRAIVDCLCVQGASVAIAGEQRFLF